MFNIAKTRTTSRVISVISRYASLGSIHDQYIEKLCFDGNESFRHLQGRLLLAKDAAHVDLFNYLPKELKSISGQNHAHSIPPVESTLVGRLFYAVSDALSEEYKNTSPTSRIKISERDSMAMQTMLQGSLKEIGAVGEVVGAAAQISSKAGHLGPPTEELLFILMGLSGLTWTGPEVPSSVDYEGTLKDGIHLIAQLPAMLYLCTRGLPSMSGDQKLALSSRDWAARTASALGGHTSTCRNLLRSIANAWLQLSAYQALYTSEYLYINRGPSFNCVRKRHLFSYLRLAFEADINRKDDNGLALDTTIAYNAIARLRSDFETLGLKSVVGMPINTTRDLDDICKAGMLEAGFSDSVLNLFLHTVRTLPFICDVIGMNISQHIELQNKIGLN